MYPRKYNPDSFVSNPGERYKIEYVGVPDEYGEIHLEEVGKTDLVELHNRDADMNNVETLYNRFCNGDITALSKVQGSYFDNFGMPKDLREMYELVNKFENSYINLDENIKNNMSFEEFLDKAGSEEWFREITKSIENKSIETSISEEVPNSN